jgi:N-acetylmuramoyl-L-alanine amidase/PKD repeat protein
MKVSVMGSKNLRIFISLLIIITFVLLSLFTPYGQKLFAGNNIVVFLDAGHGGRDTGAIGFGFYEKNANLDIALRVKGKLEASGFSVAMSRTDDATRTLDDVVNLANASGADLFVSIHNNAALSPYSHGTETYWCANGIAGSTQLASLIQTNIIASAGRANRGVKTANFRVIKNTTMPGALVECAFISNQTENDLLKSDGFREQCANGIFAGIKKFAEGINKAPSTGGSTSGNTTTTTAASGGTSNNTNTYSDTSGTTSSGFTMKTNIPANGAKIFSMFEIRGWTADLRGTPAKKLSKIEIYKSADRNAAGLLGKVENFETNVLGSEGVLNGGWTLNANIDNLSEGENILYIYAFDEAGNYSLDNLRINVIKSGNTSEINLNPIAVPGAPYKGEINTDITFNGSGSYDPDGTITEYLWDFGDGTTANVVKPAHKYAAKGTYNVTLTVKDAFGKASAAVITTAAITDPADNVPATTTTTGSTDPADTGGNAKFDSVSNATNYVGYLNITDAALVKIFTDRNSGKTDKAARLAPLYIKYAKLFNLRADIAWAQMCHETGFLEYTGDVKPEQNNYAGIGATGGGVPGNSFASEELGVIAHLSHLAWYYYAADVNEYCNKSYDPRHFGTTHLNYAGNATLGFLNGRWAPGATYTDKIVLYSNQIVQGLGSANSSATANTTVTITANAGPDKSGNAGDTLTFDASASAISVVPNMTISYMWDWNGDGTYDETVTNAVVSHLFDKAGKTDVGLKIVVSVNNNGAITNTESTDKVSVSINSIAVANAGGPYGGKVGDTIIFDGSKSADLDGTIKEYLWDFGDGTTGSGVGPAHIYGTPGELTVKLTVVDDKNVSSTTVTAKATIAEKTPGTTTDTGAATTTTAATGTTASSSSDSGTSATTAAGTTAASTTDTSSQVKSSSSQTMGSTTTETTAGGATATTETAANVVPIAKPGGPYTGTSGVNITFDGSASTDSDGTIAEYQWDFGDGTVLTNGKMPTHAYASAGAYTVKLKVKDDDGALSTEATVAVTVNGVIVQQPANTTIIANTTSFIGYTEVSADQLVSIFVSRNSGKTEWARRLAPLYIQYGKEFNMRADIAWAQMCHETGFLEFTGDVKSNQNNFVGLGATGGGVPGSSFATEELGIIAHYAHLAWYYCPSHLNQYCNLTYDPRHSGTTHYKYTGDTTVGFLNGRWAPGSTYTSKILLFANQIYGK